MKNYIFLFISVSVIVFWSLVIGLVIGRYSWDCKDTKQMKVVQEVMIEDKELIEKVKLCEQAELLRQQIKQTQELLK